MTKYTEDVGAYQPPERISNNTSKPTADGFRVGDKVRHEDIADRIGIVAGAYGDAMTLVRFDDREPLPFSTSKLRLAGASELNTQDTGESEGCESSCRAAFYLGMTTAADQCVYGDDAWRIKQERDRLLAKEAQ